MHKYGREFSVAVMENRDGCVSERVSGHGGRPLTPPNLMANLRCLLFP